MDVYNSFICKSLNCFFWEEGREEGREEVGREGGREGGKGRKEIKQ